MSQSSENKLGVYFLVPFSKLKSIIDVIFEQ